MVPMGFFLALKVLTDVIHGEWWKQDSAVPERCGHLYLARATGSPSSGAGTFLKETKRYRVLKT